MEIQIQPLPRLVSQKGGFHKLRWQGFGNFWPPRHARISAARRRERTRQPKQLNQDLNLEVEKAAFDLELAEVERLHEERKVEELKQEYINYKRRNDWNNNTNFVVLLNLKHICNYFYDIFHAYE